MAVAAVEARSGQMGLYEVTAPAVPADAGGAGSAGLCAGCHQRVARYGFRRGHRAARPGMLCFQCFRSELGRRQDVAERRRRGWNAEQAGLPLAETLEALHTRRRRAQIAARHALDGTSPASRTATSRPKAS